MKTSTRNIDLGTLMNLIEAAEAAEQKLRTEYQAGVDDGDLSHPMESWSEGENLRHALDALRFTMLVNDLKAKHES